MTPTSIQNLQDHQLVIARLKALWYVDTTLEHIAEVEALFDLLLHYPVALQLRLEEQEARICRLEEAVFGQGEHPTDTPDTPPTQ